MSAIRNKQAVRRLADDAYLDAARACILDIGVRRTTMTDIARRAGVSRMTVYRRWPDMLALLGDLMVREWLGETEALGAGEPNEAVDPQGAADTVVRIARAVRDNPLFRKIVDVDPEFMLPYVFTRRGRTQDHLLAAVATAIAEGQRAGTLREGDPQTIARALLLTAHGYVMSMQTMTDTVTAEELDEQLRIQVERYLRP